MRLCVVRVRRQGRRNQGFSAIEIRGVSDAKPYNAIEQGPRQPHLRPRETGVELQRALELDPLDLEITSHLVWHYDYSREYDRAIVAAEKSLEIDPNHRPTLTFLVWGLEGAGRFDQAVDVIQKKYEIPRSPEPAPM